MIASATPLKTLRAIVEAPVDAVAAVLLDIGPGGLSPVTPSGRIAKVDAHDQGAHTVTIEQDGSRVTVRVDPIARIVTVQGQWWYRSDITLTHHQNGSLITQQIFNVAEQLRWAVRFVARKPLAASTGGFDELLKALGKRLDRPAYPLP